MRMTMTPERRDDIQRWANNNKIFSRGVQELLDGIPEKDKDRELIGRQQARIQELEAALEPLAIGYEFEMLTAHPGATMEVSMRFLRQAHTALGKDKT